MHEQIEKRGKEGEGQVGFVSQDGLVIREIEVTTSFPSFART